MTLATTADFPSPAAGATVRQAFGTAPTWVARNAAEARAWADADPYVDAGVYARVEVRPFKRVLP